MKKKTNFLMCLIVILFSTSTLYSQIQVGKPIRGIIKDQASDEPLPYATVGILGVTATTTTSDENGNFSIYNLPIGRYDVQVSFMGYEPMLVREVLVTSGKEIFLTISLKQNLKNLQEIIITPKVSKQEPLNSIASASARMLSVEEASRYAGAMDDPARLVTSFAGVAGNMNSNGIAIRGNSPQFLQWKLEGVEIANPTHFTDITGVGGGILTALSSQVLGNSDFFTGAFPAEYNNALSGVFDMQLRNGNRWQHEHTLQIGTQGIDLSSEGPFKKGGESSYLFNYRYATMTLADKLFPGLLGEAGGMEYQDLSFKFNFPTRKAGTFSIWGIGLIDLFTIKNSMDTTKWETIDDKTSGKFEQVMASGGMQHKISLGKNSYIKTSLGFGYNKNNLVSNLLNTQFYPTPTSDLKGENSNFTLNTYINKKFNYWHTNRSGINIKYMRFNLDYNISPTFPLATVPIENFAKSDDQTMLYSAFTNSTLRISQNLTANIGLNGQYFLLNKNWTLEPRVGLKWQVAPKHSLGLAYGNHSRHEKIDYYFTTTPQTGNELLNKNLDFAKAHHFVLSYGWNFTENLFLKIEPYYQFLYNIPVMENSTFSIINHTDWFMTHALVNKGKGKNIGVDLTLERYLAKGYYYLFTASIFNSTYSGGDGVWRNTRLNRNYLLNLLGGKEWVWGKSKQHVFNANLRFSFQGGDRYTPADEQASLLAQDVVYDYAHAYEKQTDPAFISNITLSYKLNKPKTTHEFAIKVINVNGYKEFAGLDFNYKKQEIYMYKSSVVMPNISYKFEF